MWLALLTTTLVSLPQVAPPASPALHAHGHALPTLAELEALHAADPERAWPAGDDLTQLTDLLTTLRAGEQTRVDAQHAWMTTTAQHWILEGRAQPSTGLLSRTPDGALGRSVQVLQGVIWVVDFVPGNAPELVSLQDELLGFRHDAWTTLGRALGGALPIDPHAGDAQEAGQGGGGTAGGGSAGGGGTGGGQGSWVCEFSTQSTPAAGGAPPCVFSWGVSYSMEDGSYTASITSWPFLPCDGQFLISVLGVTGPGLPIPVYHDLFEGSGGGPLSLSCGYEVEVDFEVGGEPIGSITMKCGDCQWVGE